MSSNDNVVALEGVKPKRTRRRYRHHEITIEFDPKSGQWNWWFKHTYTIRVREQAKNEKKAFDDACAYLDRILDPEPA